jgi:integrase
MLEHEREAFGYGYHDSGELSCRPDGRPVHPDTITRRFNRLVDRAGVPWIRLHDVRHTYATVSQIGRVASDASFPEKRDRGAVRV